MKTLQNKLSGLLVVLLVTIFISCNSNKKVNPSLVNENLRSDIINHFDTAFNHAEIVEHLLIYDSITFNKWFINAKIFTKINSIYFRNIAHGNLDKIFQACSELDSLKSLEINDIDDIIIPGSIGKLNQITSLTLAGNVKFIVPDSICYCTNLKEISLISCKRIPSLSKLPNLESIDLNNNNLTEVPKEVLELTNIKEIYLFSNNIETIPKDIVNLKQLKKLYIFNNPIAIRELTYYLRNKKYNELDFLFQAFPNCEIVIKVPLL